MADNYKIFLLDDDVTTTNVPKVVRPNNGKLKTKDISIDSKYVIDEKEFEPVIIEHNILPLEPAKISSVEKEKARLALEKIVKESIKKKQAALAEEAKEINVINKEIPDNIERINEFAPYDKKPQYIKPINEGEVDIAVKLKAHAILSMDNKKNEQENISTGKSLLRMLLYAITFPFGLLFLKRNKKKQNIKTFGFEANSTPYQKRMELESLAVAAKELRKERERKEELIKEEINLERLNKSVIQLDVDNDVNGIEIDNTTTLPPIKKISQKKAQNIKNMTDTEKNPKFII